MGRRPAIYLTNAASLRSGPRFRGPGLVLTIMAAPRRWERGDGRVPALIPPLEWVRAAKAGSMSITDYRLAYSIDLDEHGDDLRPGRLSWEQSAGAAPATGPVAYGDTLICACSRAAAARGECHRVWAAEALARSGWRVILDGVEVERG